MTEALQILDTGRSKAGWSYYGCARKCLRKFAYENRAGIEGKRGGARGLGSLVHGLLAAHYDGWSTSTYEELAAKLAQEHEVPDDDRDLALEIYRAYRVRYAKGDWEAVSVEKEYRIGFLLQRDGSVVTVDADTPGSVLYTARIDLVARDTQGRIWAVDHKTAAKIRWGTSMRYGLHGQMHGLWHIGRHHYGADFAGVMLNFIQTRAGIDFKRERPAAAPKMIEEFPRLIVATAIEIDQWDAHATTPDDWPTASNETVCVSTYGVCDHAYRCRMGEGR